MLRKVKLSLQFEQQGENLWYMKEPYDEKIYEGTLSKEENYVTWRKLPDPLHAQLCTIRNYSKSHCTLSDNCFKLNTVFYLLCGAYSCSRVLKFDLEKEKWSEGPRLDKQFINTFVIVDPSETLAFVIGEDSKSRLFINIFDDTKGVFVKDCNPILL